MDIIKSSVKVTDQISMGITKGVADGLQITANMHLQVFDEHGNLKEERHVHNTVTTGGKNGVANQVILSPTLPKMGWMAIGTGSPSATLLGTEVARVAFDTKTVLAAVVTVTATFAAGTGTGAITEVGTFDVVTANTINMWMSASFSVVNKGALDSIAISWTLTVG